MILWNISRKLVFDCWLFNVQSMLNNSIERSISCLKFSWCVFEITYYIANNVILLSFSIGWAHWIANISTTLCMRTFFCCNFCSCRVFDQSYHSNSTWQAIIFSLNTRNFLYVHSLYIHVYIKRDILINICKVYNT